MATEVPPASAEPSAKPFELEFVIGAERIAGAYAFSGVVSDDQPATRIEESGGVVNLLTANSLSVGGLNPFVMPRVGFDLVVQGLSVGVSSGYASSAGDSRREAGTMRLDTDLGELGIWLLNPRIGYMLRMGPVLGVWPRVGMTFVWMNAAVPNEPEIDAKLMDVTIEPLLVLRPLESVAIMVGPTFDIGISGSNELVDANGTSGTERTLSNFGASAGLALVF